MFSRDTYKNSSFHSQDCTKGRFWYVYTGLYMGLLLLDSHHNKRYAKHIWIESTILKSLGKFGYLKVKPLSQYEKSVWTELKDYALWYSMSRNSLRKKVQFCDSFLQEEKTGSKHGWGVASISEDILKEKQEFLIVWKIVNYS